VSIDDENELDRFRDWDAAYVLGALSAEDRRSYERHLVTCAECSAALAELAGLPGILGKLSSEDAVALMSAHDPQTLVEHPFDAQLRDHDHTPGLVQRLAAKRRRRRARFTLIAAIAAVVAVVSVGGVAVALNQPSLSQPAQTRAVAMAPLHQKVVTASLEITKKGWGTSFAWSCSYHGTGWDGIPESYDLVVVTKSGGHRTVATWTSGGPDVAGLTASTAIATKDIRRVEIRLSGTTTPLLEANL
jgi:hypothetical protein